jgi:alpha-L-fucosidase 2
MWYRTPAEEWKEFLPIGNGVLGGMVMGGVPRERIALNHEWLWRAANRYRTTEPRHQYLQEIRDLFFQGQALEAGELANARLGGPGGVLKQQGIPNRVDPYQPAGDLWLAFEHGEATDYTRELDLSTGIVTVRYTAGDVTYARQTFCHSDLPVLCIRLTASRKGALDVRAHLSRVEDPDCVLFPAACEGSLELQGTFVEGSRFAIVTRLLLPRGGTAIPDASGRSVRITHATEAILLLAIGVAHDGEDPKAAAAEQLAQVVSDWDSLEARHREAFGSFYSRVSLDLGGARDDLPTDERLAAFQAGEQDDDLLALYFNFGRYLTISSSRPGGLPANLQGIWNQDLQPPWDCDLHHDVNLQMNYWAAEVCGLAECIEPLFDHIERFLPHAREMARALYDCDGVYFPLQTDPWGRATPESRGWDVWTGAAAWLAQHLWWRYEYGGDTGFLRERAYPFIREVAAFYASYLVRDPQGRLVTVPSQSPENFFVGGTKPVSLCIGATMDFELIHDVLTHAIAGSEILGVDEDMRPEWARILQEIPPLQIGRHGQLQEWLEDYAEGEIHHRHLSHLIGAYPGEQITVDDTPELSQAVRVSLERRLEAGGLQGGWSGAWTACLWARLREAERAYDQLKLLVSGSSVSNRVQLLSFTTAS